MTQNKNQNILYTKTQTIYGCGMSKFQMASNG